MFALLVLINVFLYGIATGLLIVRIMMWFEKKDKED